MRSRCWSAIDGDRDPRASGRTVQTEPRDGFLARDERGNTATDVRAGRDDGLA